MSAIESSTIVGFLGALGSKTPTPGGGAVASVVGAVSAALAKMVVAYSLGKKNLAAHQPALERASASLDRARGIFLQLAEEDAAGYALLNELQKLPETDPRRVAELPAATQAALAPPRATVAAAADLMRLIESLAPITNRHLRSDLAIAAVLAESAAKSGWWNVAANLSSISDPALAQSLREECAALLGQVAERRAMVERACSFDAV